MSKGETLQAQSPKTAAALTKAVVRAAKFLELSQQEFSTITKMSLPQTSRLWNGGYELNPSKAHEWELAILFFRIYRSLHTITGNNSDCVKWLRGYNHAFSMSPIERMQSLEGLVRVVGYLDAHRGNV